MGHIYVTKTVTTSAFLLTIFDTDPRETKELLSMLKYFIPVAIVAWFLYFYFVVKKVDNTWLIPSKKRRLCVLGSILLFYLVLFIYTLIRSNNQNEIYLKRTEYFTEKFKKVYPSDLLIAFKETYQKRRTIKKEREKLKDFVFHAERADTIKEREIYVLVIGESARYDNFSINGYSKETSPLLEKMPNLVTYSDYYATANTTMNCIPLMLTRGTPLHFGISQEEKTLVDAFKEAGFKTYWLGNQSGGSEYIRRIAQDADGEYFNSAGENSVNYDETLWPYFQEVLNKKDDKVLIVLHTLGNHFRYEFRYPPRFKVFTPCFDGDLNKSDMIPANREKIMNTYDNSVLYTDYFLANTIHQVDSINVISALIYVSDHGENIFDTKENLLFHTNLEYTKYDIHVPLIIWCSDKYIARNELKYDMIKQNRNKKLSASNLFYSILDIGNVTFPGQNVDKSFASETLQEDSARYIYTIESKAKKLGY